MRETIYLVERFQEIVSSLLRELSLPDSGQFFQEYIEEVQFEAQRHFWWIVSPREYTLTQRLEVLLHVFVLPVSIFQVFQRLSAREIEVRVPFRLHRSRHLSSDS